MKKTPKEKIVYLPTHELDHYYKSHKRLETWYDELIFHYTKLELQMSQSGFLDARSLKTKNPLFIDNIFYNTIYDVYSKLTTTQQVILDYHLCSGFNQTQIAQIQNYRDHKGVTFHLQAISKKINKIYKPIEVDVPYNIERKIIDRQTERYEDESTLDWFNRINE